MTLNNPPDQPSVEQITNKNNFSYTSHDHHPLTGTPFSENNTAIPTTPATLTTLTTPASDPAANLASSPAIPTTPATLTTLTTLATTYHLDSNFPLPLTTLEKAGSTMMPSPDCRILSRGEIWEKFCNCGGNSPVQAEAEPLLHLFCRVCAWCISCGNAPCANPAINLSGRRRRPCSGTILSIERENCPHCL